MVRNDNIVTKGGNTMKKLFCAALALAMMVTSGIAMAGTVDYDPHKGDQGGALSAKIEKAIQNGKDPSVYVNVQPAYTSPDLVVYTTYTYSTINQTSFTFTDVPTSYGVRDSVYEAFRSHALKWYNYAYELQRDFGNFTAYFTYAYNAEVNNYYKYGNNTKMTLDTYFNMIMTANKKPYAS